jgi:hypothetical protein
MYANKFKATVFENKVIFHPASRKMANLQQALLAFVCLSNSPL